MPGWSETEECAADTVYRMLKSSFARPISCDEDRILQSFAQDFAMDMDEWSRATTMELLREFLP